MFGGYPFKKLKFTKSVHNGRYFCSNDYKGSQQYSQLDSDVYNLCCQERNAIFYIDTCTLLHNHGLSLLKSIEKNFPEFGLKLVLLNSVFVELEKVGNREPSKKIRSQEILEKLNEMESKGLTHTSFTSSSTFSDPGFLSKIILDFTKSDLVLFTQDRKLGEVASSLPDFLSGCIDSPYSVKSFQLTGHGSLEDISNKPCDNNVNYERTSNYEKQLSPIHRQQPIYRQPKQEQESPRFPKFHAK
jgi:hypothetical protein